MRRTRGWRCRFFVAVAFRNALSQLLIRRWRRSHNPVGGLGSVDESAVKSLSIRVDVNYQSLKFAIHHSSRVAAADDTTLDRRSNVGAGYDRPLTSIPRERSVSRRISICVART